MYRVTLSHADRVVTQGNLFIELVMEDTRDFGAILNRRCKRKEARKTNKKIGTLCRVAYSKHKNVETVVKEQLNARTAIEKKREKRRRQREARAQRKLEEEDELTKFTREAEKKRKEILKEDIDAEQEEIELLERKLGLDKKKSKKPIISGDIDGEAVQKKNAERYVSDLFLALDGDGETSATEFNVVVDMSDDSDDSEEKEKEEHDDESDCSIDKEVNEREMEEDAEEVPYHSQRTSDSSDEGEGNDEDDDKVGETSMSPFSKNILTLARQAKLGTPLRERIFCLIMSATGSSECFESLKGLSLDGPDEREIVHVCVHCTLLEAQYNPFYAVILSKFCEWRKQFRLTTQFSMWDVVKTLPSLKAHKFDNLVSLITDLIKLHALGLTVFKMIHLEENDSRSVTFVKRVVHRLLTKVPDAIQRQAFMSLVNTNKNQRFVGDFENFLAQLDVSQFRELDDFDVFQRQLGTVKRLFAVR